MNYLKVNLTVQLDEIKISEKKFTKLATRVFEVFSNLSNYMSSEQKMGFVINSRTIEINISKVESGSCYKKLQKALKLIENYLENDDLQKLGSVYCSHNDKEILVFSFKNIIYLSDIIEGENKNRVQHIMNLKGQEVMFNIDEGIDENLMESTVVVAHLTLNN
ncbi:MULTISPECIES: hypothetical protein [Bacillus cereus group]|uniref:Uncharacterized protein n=1 Tax=Bacillus thuringiensis serovar mexicanensis TaxID=180868 RepID=A0A242WAP2_BACTU|nr:MULTISPECIES: hypothetical protein [Bacillus cereus group]MEB9673953.1 hypothetical protein [Bacillus anthracis]OTW50864.1 hypothetical protein BK699_09980 [Bacillus thuringiensis serovar mexicanensis]OTX09549.1 hypothetical protein BK705_05025 [Bacillus thuringiensis serovar monterrey]